MKNKAMIRFKRSLIGFFGFLAVLVSSILAWAAFYYPASDEALAALSSSQTVRVHIQGHIVFDPIDAKDTAFLFYPGGKVDEKAYAYLGRAIASAGYPAIIVKMPLRLAVLDPGAAKKIMASFPETRQWVISGHSLGGAMAANYAYRHPETVQGLVLLAAYPASSNDLSSYPVKTLSITGTEDRVMDPERFAQTKDLLPVDTEFMAIPGANHAQFGDYGFQKNDGIAQIEKETQHAVAVEKILELLAAVDAGR